MAGWGWLCRDTGTNGMPVAPKPGWPFKNHFKNITEAWVPLLVSDWLGLVGMWITSALNELARFRNPRARAFSAKSEENMQFSGRTLRDHTDSLHTMLVADPCCSDLTFLPLLPPSKHMPSQTFAATDPEHSTRARPATQLSPPAPDGMARAMSATQIREWRRQK